MSDLGLHYDELSQRVSSFAQGAEAGLFRCSPSLPTSSGGAYSHISNISLNSICLRLLFLAMRPASPPTSNPPRLEYTVNRRTDPIMLLDYRPLRF
jgi:hypothetical protein